MPCTSRVGLIARQQPPPSFSASAAMRWIFCHKGQVASWYGMPRAATVHRKRCPAHAVAADDHLAPGRHILHGVHYLCALAPHILHRLRVVDRRAQRLPPCPSARAGRRSVLAQFHTKAEPRRFRQNGSPSLTSPSFPCFQQCLLVGAGFLVSAASAANCIAGIGSP